MVDTTRSGDVVPCETCRVVFSANISASVVLSGSKVLTELGVVSAGVRTEVDGCSG